MLSRCAELSVYRAEADEGGEGWSEDTMTPARRRVLQDTAPLRLFCRSCHSLLDKLALEQQQQQQINGDHNNQSSSTVGEYMHSAQWRVERTQSWTEEWQDKFHKQCRLSVAKQELLLTKAALQLSTTTVSVALRQELEGVIRRLYHSVGTLAEEAQFFQQQQQHSSLLLTDEKLQDLVLQYGFQLPFAVCDQETHQQEQALLNKTQEGDVQAAARGYWVEQMQAALGRQKVWNESVAVQNKALLETLHSVQL